VPESPNTCHISPVKPDPFGPSLSAFLTTKNTKGTKENDMPATLNGLLANPSFFSAVFVVFVTFVVQSRRQNHPDSASRA
jgi:hypothetical protein